MDQASITIDISVEKKCVLVLLNSNYLNPWIRIIEHLLRLIKVVITGENGFHMLYLSISYSTQHEGHTNQAPWKNKDGHSIQTDDVDEQYIRLSSYIMFTKIMQHMKRHTIKETMYTRDQTDDMDE